jgi:hypothetical protein
MLYIHGNKPFDLNVFRNIHKKAWGLAWYKKLT